MRTVPLEAHDNVIGCRLYGAKQPEMGRNATEEELTHIRQWIHSAELIKEFLDGSNGSTNTKKRIIIDLIHGQPIQITSLSEEMIHLVDGGGAIRILKQVELQAFLNAL